MELNSDINLLSIGPSIYTDLGSLDNIRKQAQVDSPAAIKAAAKEFEAFFMKMMLKSMRQASEVIGEDSPFTSQQEKMYIGMFDEQLSVELSQRGTLGIADLMARNILGPSYQSDDQVITYNNNPLLRKKATLGSGESGAVIAPKPVESFAKPLDNQPTVGQTSIEPPLQLSAASLKFTETVPVIDKIPMAEKKSLFATPKDFVRQLYPLARKSAEELGIDPKLLVSQAALETGWGQYVMHSGQQASHNLFGIKSNNSWQGEAVVISTLEVEGGAFKSTQAAFKMYQNFEKSFEDYVSFIQHNPRYKQALKAVGNAGEYLSSLQSAGYATDPDYAKKILSIFNRDIIQQAEEFTR